MPRTGSQMSKYELVTFPQILYDNGEFPVLTGSPSDTEKGRLQITTGSEKVCANNTL